MSQIEHSQPRKVAASQNPATQNPATSVMQRAYRVWAPVYDLVCGGLFLSSRRQAAAIARASGQSILEIGVGTGLSLQDYAAHNEIVGIDLSPEMIARAQARVQDGCPAASCMLEVMDAHHLGFPDGKFDVVVAQFVITLVEDAERVLDECRRVARPGGQIILVNHFYSETGMAAWLERKLAPLVHHIGLRPDFPFGRIVNWARSHPDMVIIERRASGPFGAFSILRLRKSAAVRG